MDPSYQPMVLVSLPLVAALLLGRYQKRAYVVGGGVLLAFAAAMYLGAIDPYAGLQGGPWSSLWILLAWIEFIAFAQWAGGFPMRGPLGVLAFVGGGLLGEVGATLLLVSRTTEPSNKARVALCASAGALASPIGHPVSLLLVEPEALGWLPYALAAVAWPKGWAQDSPAHTLVPFTRTGFTRNFWILVIVAVGVAGWNVDLWVLAGGCFALVLANRHIGTKPKTPWRDEIWIGGVALLCFLALSAGALWEAQEGMRLWLESEPAGGGTAMLALGGGLLSLVATEEAATYFVHSLASAGFTGISMEAWRAVGAGIAVLGMTPLVLIGCVRVGLRFWVMQLGVLLLWLALGG